MSLDTCDCTKYTTFAVDEIDWLESDSAINVFDIYISTFFQLMFL